MAAVLDLRLHETIVCNEHGVLPFPLPLLLPLLPLILILLRILDLASLKMQKSGQKPY